jgi:hypothetical protein
VTAAPQVAYVLKIEICAKTGFAQSAPNLLELNVHNALVMRVLTPLMGIHVLEIRLTISKNLRYLDYNDMYLNVRAVALYDTTAICVKMRTIKFRVRIMHVLLSVRLGIHKDRARPALALEHIFTIDSISWLM